MAHNLPAFLSSFVGRREEMAAVAKLLDSARLVTLVGAAGVGKTRLAIQVASAAFELHGEGVSLARLAPVDDPSLVAAAVAAAVGVREQPGHSMLQALISHLSSRRLLLVLDNCEHVIDAAAALAEALLGACPELRILATSRQALGVAGEAAWPVPPLSVPPSHRLRHLLLWSSRLPARVASASLPRRRRPAAQSPGIGKRTTAATIAISRVAKP